MTYVYCIICTYMYIYVPYIYDLILYTMYNNIQPTVFKVLLPSRYQTWQRTFPHSSMIFP